MPCCSVGTHVIGCVCALAGAHAWKPLRAYRGQAFSEEEVRRRLRGTRAYAALSAGPVSLEKSQRPRKLSGVGSAGCRAMLFSHKSLKRPRPAPRGQACPGAEAGRAEPEPWGTARTVGVWLRTGTGGRCAASRQCVGSPGPSAPPPVPRTCSSTDGGFGKGSAPSPGGPEPEGRVPGLQPEGKGPHRVAGAGSVSPLCVSCLSHGRSVCQDRVDLHTRWGGDVSWPMGCRAPGEERQVGAGWLGQACHRAAMSPCSAEAGSHQDHGAAHRGRQQRGLRGLRVSRASGLGPGWPRGTPGGLPCGGMEGREAAGPLLTRVCPPGKSVTQA